MRLAARYVVPFVFTVLSWSGYAANVGQDDGLVLTIAPAGFWCDGVGQVVATITNRGRRSATLGLAGPHRDPADQFDSYSYRFSDQHGADVPDGHGGMIVTFDCVKPPDGKPCDYPTKIILARGESVTGLVRLQKVPTTVETVSLELTLSLALVSGPLIQNTRVDDVRATEDLELVKMPGRCWHPHRRATRR